MHYHLKRATHSLVIVAVMICLGMQGYALGQANQGPIALAASGKTLYVVEARSHEVAVVDTTSNKIVRQIKLPQCVRGAALCPSGKCLFVTGGGANGKVYLVNPQDGKIKAEIAVGHTPGAPVVSPDGKTLYVCNRFDDSVSVIDLKTRKIRAEVPVIREPGGAVLARGGKDLYVLNLLPKSRADGDYTACSVTVIDTETCKVITNITLPNGSNQLLGICLSPDGHYVYVTHVLARYQLPTTQLERGWINTNALSVIDTGTRSTRKLVNTALLDDVDLGAANPWGVACTADGKSICVAHAGTDQISVIDRALLHERLDKAAKGEKVTDVVQNADDVPNDLSFLVGAKKRIKLAGKGARSLAIIGSTVYVGEYFSDTLTLVDLASPRPSRVTSVALGSDGTESVVRKGEMLFNDANLCFQKWQSCASCHTAEARVDALNWDLLNDGLGNPKNTKSLLLAHATPPSMSLAVRATAEEAVRAGIRHIQFAVRPESDAQAIDAYLKSLKPVPSPYLDKGKLSKSALRGKTVFEKAQCGRCHSGPYYTNKRSYDVDTGLNREKGKEFDTPGLVELWRSGPYLHDGRANTLREVLTTFNASNKHGKTDDLNEENIEDLVAYLLSL
jgi:YVTN family beta-propeller protein